ncbi:multicopper oxidase family protein [Salinicoccus roseus]|uniref:multicopper oxidase family protein n=1 Tax=Salinicoccus roseus TaxID=45670 RepID=UPI001CA76DFC|nr:multicopper oxidase family protein [Salinicoccus roseus]MBY8908737.1 multicopper oxidase family protein [Salinicoccus roseus]
MNRKIIGSILIAILLGVLVFGSILFNRSPFPGMGPGSSQSEGGGGPESSGVLDESEGTSILDVNAQDPGDRPVKSFELTAQETKWDTGDGVVSAWTYNGTVPGEMLRVTEGDFVRIELKNELEVPVTIHWHGVILPNRMDGVPGLTQDAVQPGETFTYEYIAEDAGTYWYHSHQHSSLQVDKGLYGALVVEEKEKEYDRDAFFLLDEWAVDVEDQDTANMPGMMMGGMTGDGEADTKQLYDTFTVNGRTGDAIEPLMMENGETMRLRFVNAGYQQHQLVFPEGSMMVIANDGEPVEDTGNSNVLEVAPGERIDVAFTKTSGSSQTIAHRMDVDHAEGMRIPVVSESDTEEEAEVAEAADVSDGISHGSENLLFEAPPEPDVTYDMDLDMGMGGNMGEGMNMLEGMEFLINGETFPDTPPIEVEPGDIVRVNITNNGRMNHPMHLHGHRFQVQSKDGEPFDQPIVKDLIHVKPGESYTIYFEADNSGEWLFHCHDNNHAGQGMMTIVDYQNTHSPFELGGEHENNP